MACRVYHPGMDVALRARIAAAVTARDLSDSARTVVRALTEGFTLGEITAAAARMRTESLALLDRAVLADLAAGATWEQIGAVLNLTAREVRDRYEPVLDRWALTELDPAPVTRASIACDARTVNADDAAAVDSWLVRHAHADPWDDEPRARLADLIA